MGADENEERGGEFCHQCYGRRTVVIEGQRVPCTCTWRGEA